MQNAVDVSNLTVHYDKQTVLWDINFSISPGNIVGVVGPNGAGKTTLIKSLIGVVKPLSGKISFFGDKLSKIKKQIAYLPQKEAIDWDFPITVFDVVLMGKYGGIKWYQRIQEEDKKAARQALDKVGLLSFAHRQINELSGGQKQRLFFARALVQNAKIYFMDEPFQGIDLTTEKVLITLLQEMKEEGKTIFIVHHDLSSVIEYFTELILLNTRLVAAGAVSSVWTEENLGKTFGKHPSLLEEAFYLNVGKKKGFIST